MYRTSDLPARSLLTPFEVASFYDVSLRTVYFWHRIGKIQGIKIWRFLRIYRSSLRGIRSALRPDP